MAADQASESIEPSSSAQNASERAPLATSTAPLSARLSRGHHRVVGPFTLHSSQQGTDLPTPNGMHFGTPTTGDKRPLSVEPRGTDDLKHDVNGAAGEPPKKRARKSAVPKPVTQYCHQDHQAHDVSQVKFLHCTAQKIAGKPKPGSEEIPTRPCSLSYCARCLGRGYSENVENISASGADASWTCPSCRGICSCSSCRRRSGLDAGIPLKELGADPASPVGPVTGGRRAAAAARTKLSSGFTASGKVAAVPLTNGGGMTSSPAGGKSRRSKGKKAGKPKANGTTPDGALSDSSLSELTDSDEEKSSSRKTVKGKAKLDADSPGTAGSATGKRMMPPRAPRDLPTPPQSHILASVWVSGPTLPCDESIRARLHLREWFLRFLPCLPSLDPSPPAVSNASSSKSSSSRTTAKTYQLSPHLARVLSALSDDILWLWRDRDSAAEAVQLRLLQGLCELLLREKPYTGVVHKLQREHLEDLRVELRTALSGVQRQREVFDRPWRTAQKIAEGGPGSYWVEEGPKWQKEAAERRQRAEALRKSRADKVATDDAGGSTANGQESDLSSIASSDDEDGTSKKTGGDDDDVDQLASDYEEPPPKLDKAGRRMKGERDMPGEQRLAVLCALIELASSSEAVRNEIAQGVDLHYTEMIALRRKRFELRKELAAEKALLESSKTEKPAGNSSSAKVKEWQEQSDTIDDKVKQLDEDATRSSWKLQHDFFTTGAKYRIRFVSIGTDAHGTEYYTPAPAPREVLMSSVGSVTSGFPFDRKPSDDGVRDYPLSWCIVGHGRRPAATGVGAAALKVEPDADPAGADAVASASWFTVRGVEDLDALAEWVELSARHAEYALRLAQFQLEHPKTKTNGVVRPAPTEAEMAAYERAAERADESLPDALRQFADAIKWQHEMARRASEGGEGAMAERTRAHRA